jgi:hypothetical protein
VVPGTLINHTRVMLLTKRPRGTVAAWRSGFLEQAGRSQRRWSMVPIEDICRDLPCDLPLIEATPPIARVRAKPKGGAHGRRSAHLVYGTDCWYGGP